MCRLTVYKGRSFLIGDLVVRPENGLLFQSRDAAWHPGVADGMGKRNIRVNADGFGIAWYSRGNIDVDEYAQLVEDTKNDVNASSSIYGLRAYMYESCIFKFVTPAWSNKNLKNIGEHVRSNLICAHVRAGSNGLNPDESFRVTVTEENCHPFQYRQWTFMHNGGIPHFENIKFPIIQLLDEMCWHGIAGNTDSEHIFALFLALLPDRDNPNVELAELIETVEKTIACILELCEKHNGVGAKFCCSLNLVFTDGCHIVATRYRSTCDGHTEPPSLYYNWGNDFVCEDGEFKMRGGAEGEKPFKANEIVISSAPLSNSGGLVLDTEAPHSAEYPSEIVFERYDILDTSNHSKSGNSDCGGKRLRSDSHYRQQSSSGGVGGYGHMGQWVLMPKNHMLVCVGDEDDPSSVEGVYLLEINDLAEVHTDVVECQMQRKGEMDRRYKARYKERVKKQVVEKKLQMERRKNYFKKDKQEMNTLTASDDSTDATPATVATEMPTRDHRSLSPLPMKAATVARGELAERLPTSPLKQERKRLFSSPVMVSAKPRSESEPSRAPGDSYYSQLLAVVAPPPVMPSPAVKPEVGDEYVVVNKKTLWGAAVVLALSGGFALAAMQLARKA